MMINWKPDLIETLERENITLRRSGKYLKGICPLPDHSEKIPSFTIYPESQSFYCFGCHEHGDIISFIQKYKNLSFGEALLYLGINGKPFRVDRKELKKRELLRAFRQWCMEYFNDLTNLYRTLQRAKEKIKSVEEAEAISSYYHKESKWLSHIEILTNGNDRNKFELYCQVIGGSS